CVKGDTTTPYYGLDSW
nr:immunoglobulin heavy chain junction region [Macaca mulatta]MOW26575.1 immunoglobulin heavy chain junction region [Macaca mulatta]